MKHTRPPGDFTEEEALCVHYLFENSIAFNDYFIPQAWKSDTYLTRYYQYPIVLAEDAVIVGGRSWGKSITLESAVVQVMLKGKNVQSVLTAFRRLHIRDREEKIISYFENVPYFKMFLQGKKHTIRESLVRSPIYMITLLNGHIHYGISIGDDPLAINIQGTHPSYRFGEEFQFYPRQAWIKFLAARDPKGSVDKFIGVADGRSDTPYSELASGQIERFRNFRFRVSRRMEPYFNQETKKECIDTFRSELSNEFLQQVDAKDGEPVFGFWNIGDIANNFDKTENPGQPGSLAHMMHTIELTPKEYEGKIPGQALYGLPLLPQDDIAVILAIDAGYTQPTMILPFFYWKNKWQLHTRIILRNKIIFDDQAEIIDYLSDFFNATYIPIDCSSAEGKAIATALQNPKNIKYSNKRYKERLPWMEFQKPIIVGHKEDDECKLVEVKVPAKIHTSNILHRMFADREFNIYSDEDMLLDFNKEFQKTTQAGNAVIHTPFDVHIPEAFRCFAFARWLMQGGSPKPPEPEGDAEDYTNNWGVNDGDFDFKMFGREPRRKTP